MSDTQLQTPAAGVAVTQEAGDFAALLSKEFRPKSDRAREAVEAAVQTLAEQALAHATLISDDALTSIQSMITAIDAKLTEQVNLILHHEDFQGLESAWRGLHYLVNNTETDEMLKIRVLNISKKELGRNLKKFRGTAWDQSPIFKKVYEEEYGQFGGEPFGVLIGDYYFDHSPQDTQLLGDIAQVAAAAHVPFIAGAAPSLMQMDSWAELANPRDLTKIFQTPEYAAWRSLRAMEDARYLGLCMPRMLTRVPYGMRTDPVDGFAFEEEVEGPDASHYAWTNAAFAMAGNIARSFSLYSWCSRIHGIETGGIVEGLPALRFPTADGAVDNRCCTEIALDERRESELARVGLIPLMHR